MPIIGNLANASIYAFLCNVKKSYEFHSVYSFWSTFSIVFHYNVMAQPKRRRIGTVDNSRQTSLFAYCLPTSAEGQLSSY